MYYNTIHIIERYSWLWIQSAINNERCFWPWGYNAAPIRVCGTEKYIATRRTLNSTYIFAFSNHDLFTHQHEQEESTCKRTFLCCFVLLCFVLFCFCFVCLLVFVFGGFFFVFVFVFVFVFCFYFHIAQSFKSVRLIYFEHKNALLWHSLIMDTVLTFHLGYLK